MRIRDYLRSARGPQDAERAYTIVAGECERNLAACGHEMAARFEPWSSLVTRAQRDAAAVGRVQEFAAALVGSQPLRADDPEAADATAVAMAYGYCVRALDLSDSVASLSAGWCWLQIVEAQERGPE